MCFYGIPGLSFFVGFSCGVAVEYFVDRFSFQALKPLRVSLECDTNTPEAIEQERSMKGTQREVEFIFYFSIVLWNLLRGCITVYKHLQQFISVYIIGIEMSAFRF